MAQPAKENNKVHRQTNQNEQSQPSIINSTYYNTTRYATFCMTTFELSNSTLTIPAILDTGSSVTLIPYSHIKGTKIEKKLIKTDVKITGVSPGYSPIIGKIDCDVIIGADCKFHNLCVYVTTHTNPCLIGNNILRHESVVSFNQNNVNHCITIKRLVDGKSKIFRIQQFDQNHQKISSQRAKFSGNLNSKMEWLKTNGINFPVKSDPDNQKQIQDDDISKVTFDYFLKSRTFTLFTDHKSLIYLDRKSFSHAKLRRWQDELMA